MNKKTLTVAYFCLFLTVALSESLTSQNSSSNPTSTASPPISPTQEIIIIIASVVSGIFILMLVIGFLSSRCFNPTRVEAEQQASSPKNQKTSVQKIKVFSIKESETTIAALNSRTQRNQAQCIICLEPVRKLEILLDPCGHSDFHWGCFKQWVGASKSRHTREKCCRCMTPIQSVKRVMRKPASAR